MRLVIVISLFVLGSLFISCDENTSNSDIPSVVLNTFNLEFKQVEDISWKRRGEHYEVEFEIEDVDHSALINAAGKLIKYKKEIEIRDLPQEVLASIRSAGSGKIGELHLLVIENKKYYQVEIDGRLTDSYMIFLESGEEVENVIYFE
ncbi:hypothetical protein FK178_03825 [Antarcticibacterium arcticum]|uniref:Uncharacterized protein n=1 Tax=Antarcticibacterium arcticum TaxID=2585771 RepID=A0A5B8YFY2_9FLAO|nr:hypothetical protein [Antarcticibacterium arcticum]QED36892.1 hypothetical protein FK178_03825 [Antarcticibacterium arcticum]